MSTTLRKNCQLDGKPILLFTASIQRMVTMIFLSHTYFSMFVPNRNTVSIHNMFTPITAMEPLGWLKCICTLFILSLSLTISFCACKLLINTSHFLDRQNPSILKILANLSYQCSKLLSWIFELISVAAEKTITLVVLLSSAMH